MARSPSFEPGAVHVWKRVVARRWRGGIATFLLVAALAVAVVFLPRPTWRAEATLRLGAPAPVGGLSLGGTNSPSGLFSLFQQMTGDPFANELELLTSRTVVEGVVTDNALNVALLAPRGWDRDSLLTALAAARSTRKATYQATWLPSGDVAIRRTAPADAVYGPFAPGRPAAFDGVVATFRPWRSGMPRTVKLRTIPFGEAVRRTKGRLVAERKRREANLVRIAYDDPDAGLALAVVRSTGARYQALRAAIQRRESGQTTDSLRTVEERTLAELRRDEDGLERFQREARLVAPQAQGEAFVKRASEVDAALATARAELAGVTDVLARLAAAPDPATAWAGLVAHPTFLENKTLGDLLGTLVHLEQQRLDLGGRRTAEDRTVESLDRQITYLDGSLRSLVRQYRDGVAGQVALLEKQRAALDSVLLRAPADEIELARRQRAVRLLSEVYLFTDQRLRQEGLRDALSFASVQVVDPPEVLFKPVWPRKGLGLGAGLLLAITFGTLAVALAERADRSMRSAADIQAVAGAPVVAAVAPGARGELVLAPAEARALLHARNGGAPPRRLVLAPVAGAVDDTAALARLLLVPAAELVPAGGGGGSAAVAGNGGPRQNGHRPGLVGPAPRTYPAAAALAAEARAGARRRPAARGRRRRPRRRRGLRGPTRAGGPVVLAARPRPRERLSGGELRPLPPDGRARRVAEVLGALLLLLLALPILVAGALLVLVGSGRPAFFGHVRVGRGGRPFRCWKLRTMKRGAELHLVLDGALRARYARNGYKLPLREDPRITGVGRLLRRSHVDEIPQLFNVLNGTMSLVGPRPVIEEELREYGDDAADLLRARPGIFGEWTSRGRARPSYPERAEIELRYVRTRTLEKDLRILLRSIPVVLRGQGE